MRKLRNTLYVFTEDAYLALDGENVVAKTSGKEIGRIPLHTLEGIVSFSYAGASPKLMGACGDRGISLSFYDTKGRFLARAVGSQQGNVLRFSGFQVHVHGKGSIRYPYQHIPLPLVPIFKGEKIGGHPFDVDE